MSDNRHIVVWIDRQLCRLLALIADTTIDLTVRTPETPHAHRRSAEGHHVPIDRDYLDRITAALGDAAEILITGPGSAKLELVTHLTTHHPDVAARVVGVETLDRPTAGELKNIAYAAFRKADRMLPRRLT